MKKYTQEDVDRFEVVDGRKQYPSGDYSDIKIFPDNSDFGDECLFGERCRFGVECSFGERCSFGEWCNFVGWSSFGKQCRFGEWGSFGVGCRFRAGCSFEVGCSFGEQCSFGEGCKAKSPLWAYVYDLPFATEGPIYPTPDTRGYWQERLGMELKGCYDRIAKKVVPLLPELLKRTDLTRCERRILESWLPEVKE